MLLRIGFLNIIFDRGFLWEEGVGSDSRHPIEQKPADGAVAGVFYLTNIFQLVIDRFYIPATTNRLEAFFRHLKEKLGVHHGLTLANKKNFIKWYLFFQNQRQ